MKKAIIPTRVNPIRTVQCYVGESIEEKVRRIVNNNEPIEDTAPLIYTERKDGVRPEFNIRTDKWDIALEAMMKVNDAKEKQRARNIAKGNNFENVELPEGMKNPEGTNTKENPQAN